MEYLLESEPLGRPEGVIVQPVVVAAEGRGPLEAVARPGLVPQVQPQPVERTKVGYALADGQQADPCFR